VAAGFRVIAPDTRGYNLSSKPEDFEVAGTVKPGTDFDPDNIAELFWTAHTDSKDAGRLSIGSQAHSVAPAPTGADRPTTGSASPAGLQFPGADDGVLNGISIPVLDVGDDHHVPGEALGHRERIGERLEQEIAKVKRCSDDDVGVVELPGHQAPAVSPVEQAVATTLGDPVKLSRQTAEMGELHHAMLACLREQGPTPSRGDLPRASVGRASCRFGIPGKRNPV
jgi:hypothetical protein